MAMPMINECYSPSLKHKLKCTISCFTCRHDDVERLGGGGSDCRRSQTTTHRSPCSWLKSSAQDPDIKDKYMGLIGKRGKNTRRGYNSADFRYDIASYSLNFDEVINREDELPLQNFSSRLPATRDRSLAVTMHRRGELNAWIR